MTNQKEIPPGKYDNACAAMCAMLQAETVLLAVIGGVYGNGFSVTASINPELIAGKLPPLLRMMADSIEEEQREAKSKRDGFTTAE